METPQGKSTTGVTMPASPSKKPDVSVPITATHSYGTLKRLVAVALFVALIFVYVFFGQTVHDPLWWHHAGITEHTKGELHPVIKKVQQERAEAVNPMTGVKVQKNLGELSPATQTSHDDEVRERHSKPINGSAFIADYDVSQIVPKSDPPLDKAHPKYLFHYMNKSTSKFKFEYLSSEPMVAWVPNFLTDAECDAIIAEASKTMQRSQVLPDRNAKLRDLVQDVRTSSQTWMSVDHATTKPVIDRIFELTGFASGSSEMLQVLRYEKGQKYDAHIDYFDPKLHGPQTSNRAVTVFIYLSTVEEGGYTQFPRAQGKPPTWDFKSCEAGLKVRPVKGTLAIFYDMKPNGEYDDYSLHGGCKPVKGTKWAGTLWLRVPV